MKLWFWLLHMCVCCSLASLRITRSESWKTDPSFLRWFYHNYLNPLPSILIQNRFYSYPEMVAFLSRLQVAEIHTCFNPDFVAFLSRAPSQKSIFALILSMNRLILLHALHAISLCATLILDYCSSFMHIAHPATSHRPCTQLLLSSTPACKFDV
jgi:hypothetical protein